MADEPEQRQMPVMWGYSEDSIEINDAPEPQKKIEGTAVVQQITMPIGAWDVIVMDYIKHRRERFVAQGHLQGTLFDDDLHQDF